jgi:hypothetical protein
LLSFQLRHFGIEHEPLSRPFIGRAILDSPVATIDVERAWLFIGQMSDMGQQQTLRRLRGCVGFTPTSGHLELRVTWSDKRQMRKSQGPFRRFFGDPETAPIRPNPRPEM